MSAERIHINEAVRTYNKTRQTFYNWIKKWYLQSKKINNKVYVATHDVEQLLSDYIGEHLTDKRTEENDLTHHDAWVAQIDETMLYELVAEMQQQKHFLTQKVDDQKINLMHELHLTKQELRTDIQRAAEWVQQQQNIIQSQTHKQLVSTQQTLHSLTKRFSLLNKRNSFWLWYLLFVGANIVILTLLA